MKKFFIPILCIILSIISGIVTNDLLLGGSILLSGLLCAYYASIGKKINYIFGLINYILMGYVSFLNNLYGMTTFYLLVFTPLQIQGYISWNKSLNEDNSVISREFNLRNSVIIIISCLIGSLLLGYVLSLIPKQQLSFLDASSNIINLCGVILMILRFKEAWCLWLFNNIIDLTIWIIVVINNGTNSLMMLLVSIGYLIINIYGIVKWYFKDKRKDN